MPDTDLPQGQHGAVGVDTEVKGSVAHDLNPHYRAGGNEGPANSTSDARTAYDVKDAHRLLSDLHDDELKQISIVPVGTRLEQGATYLDLRSDIPEEFSARGDMEAGPDALYVPKTGVPYPLWNRLIGVDTPERLNEESE